MTIKLINDWKYLFDKSFPGRCFTFIMISYMSQGFDTKNIKLGGLTIVVLGLGAKVSRNAGS